ncbi:hypothetical protein K3495_g8174 [Podosphaera aphanis]|nr:hypothetical protein K3495_g8174 [Podosphaera aphanis]
MLSSHQTPQVTLFLQNSLLVQRQLDVVSEPVARLLRKNDVYCTHSLDCDAQNRAFSTVAAPGVARIPLTSSAQRWDQRLGHSDLVT